MYDMIKLCEKHNILNNNKNSQDYCFATIHRPYNTDDVKPYGKNTRGI